MSKSSPERIRRRLVRRGAMEEIERRAGRSFDRREVLKAIDARIAEKEAQETAWPQTKKM